MSTANIRVLRYRGIERGTDARQQLVSDERIDGPIPTQLARAREEIAARLPKRRALGRGGRFENVGLDHALESSLPPGARDLLRVTRPCYSRRVIA
jgi:hypothetical protein